MFGARADILQGIHLHSTQSEGLFTQLLFMCKTQLNENTSFQVMAEQVFD